MNFELFIAKRIYRDKGDRRQVSRPAIRIATLGVAVGLAVMIISVCVVLGFKHTIRDKVIGFGSHIEVTNYLDTQGNEQYPVVMGDSIMKGMSRIPGVRHVERYAMAKGILKTDDDFLGIAIKGVGPEYDTTFLHQNLVEGSLPKFSDSTSSNKIVISASIASALKLKTGQKVYAYFIDENGVRVRRFSVAAIYETHLNQYDKVMTFSDINTVRRLNGWDSDQASGAEITIHDFNNLNTVADEFVSRVNRLTDHNGQTYTSRTIKEANPQIFSWLDLLDMNVWIILALMVAVAGVTMISGLLIIILERTQMIGVLKALGARNSSIRHIFLWFATFITVRGLLIGNILGIGLCLIQQLTGLVKLDPSVYYVSTVPLEFNIPIIIALNVATLLISMFVLIGPSFLISRIHPAKSMHYE